MMRFRLPALLFASAALAPLAAAPPGQPAPLAAIARQTRLPFEQFTLANGLRVVVSTDRKAPVVAVSVWYHIGSKDEPAGKTGFAHLFEHLMFNGSENAPGDFFGPLEKVGATDYNGTTSFDRTNYFETVPTPALPLALFLESDRMGHLLGAVGQPTLDRQRGVVQNEKRQDDNQPYGLVQYAEQQALFPGRPSLSPHHDRLDGRSRSCQPGGRARLVPRALRPQQCGAGARRRHRRSDGAAAGREIFRRHRARAAAGADAGERADASRAQGASCCMIRSRPRASIANGRSRGSPTPTPCRSTSRAACLGGLASSRLDNMLVRKEGLAVAVTANAEALERVGQFEVTVDVKPGVDPAMVGKRLDAIIADFVANGPTADEIQRAVTQEIAGRLFGMEKVGGFNGRASVLAQGALYAGDPGFYEKQLAEYAAATPASIKAALQKWLSRPGLCAHRRARRARAL